MINYLQLFDKWYPNTYGLKYYPKECTKHYLKEERDSLYNKLTKNEKQLVNDQKKYRLRSVFSTKRYLENTEWEFDRLEVDWNYQKKVSKNLRCKCGYPLKYQYVIKSTKSNQKMGLGITHFKDHLNISQKVADEIKRGINRIDVSMDELLWLKDRKYEFPEDLWKKYNFALYRNNSYNEPVKLNKTLGIRFSEFKRTNFPIFTADYQAILQEIRKVDLHLMEYSPNLNPYRNVFESFMLDTKDNMELVLFEPEDDFKQQLKQNKITRKEIEAHIELKYTPQYFERLARNLDGWNIKKEKDVVTRVKSFFKMKKVKLDEDKLIIDVFTKYKQYGWSDNFFLCLPLIYRTGLKKASSNLIKKQPVQSAKASKTLINHEVTKELNEEIIMNSREASINKFKIYLDEFLTAIEDARSQIIANNIGRENYFKLIESKRETLLSDIELTREFMDGHNLVEFPFIKFGDVFLYYDSQATLYQKNFVLLSTSHPKQSIGNFLEKKSIASMRGIYDSVWHVSSNKIALGNSYSYEKLFSILEKLNNGKSHVDINEQEVLPENESLKINDSLEEKEGILEYIEKTFVSKNIILTGPSGVGKTYLAKKIASEMIGISIEELNNHDQFEFIQFHQDYAYDDFVGGAKLIIDEEQKMQYRIRPGIFTEFLNRVNLNENHVRTDFFEESWDAFFEKVKNNFKNTETASYEIKNTSGEVIQIQPYFQAENQGVRIKGQNRHTYTKDDLYQIYLNNDSPYKNREIDYSKLIIEELKRHFDLNDYYDMGKISQPKPFVFVIDEIDQGNFINIFGELSFAMERENRGVKGKIISKYQKLLGRNNQHSFIPENVYIIGTMSSINNSQAKKQELFRKFRVLTVPSTMPEQLEKLDSLPQGKETINRMLSLNKAISSTIELDEKHHIGVGYFLKIEELQGDFELLWEEYIEPVLKNYLGTTKDHQKLLVNFKKAYNKV
ncbi:AAA family ATPase [Vagococcus xieshaowenii]|nr:AAA family ATPase [Vagococcus xieshaowenii]